MGAAKDSQIKADDSRLAALMQLAREGDEAAGNDLWREFGIVAALPQDKPDWTDLEPGRFDHEIEDHRRHGSDHFFGRN